MQIKRILNLIYVLLYSLEHYYTVLQHMKPVISKSGLEDFHTEFTEISKKNWLNLLYIYFC